MLVSEVNITKSLVASGLFAMLFAPVVDLTLMLLILYS
ncbi:hypothetical protein BBROOKSOX_19 [Bathymodiolus brooksi thiotrophic gill symbiont]|nr:hypothetical protein BBROOKSOX_19 [Bathymodiolus brooksi thiotrophic gill symbiont]